MTELLRIQAIVMSAKLEQFGMCALLRDLSILDHDNSIGSPDCRKTMGDDKRSASLHQSFHAALDERFSQCIYAGGSFIHDEQFRSSQHGSRQTDQLFLSDRQQVAAFAYILVIAFLEHDDEVMGAGDLRGLDDLLVTGVQTSITDVVADAA